MSRMRDNSLASHTTVAVLTWIAAMSCWKPGFTTSVQLADPEADAFEPLPAESVLVFQSQDDVPGAYDVVALVTASQPSTRCDLIETGITDCVGESQIISALQKRAGEVGAGAIIINRILISGSAPPDWQVSTGKIDLDRGSRRADAQATAIRITARVELREALTRLRTASRDSGEVVRFADQDFADLTAHVSRIATSLGFAVAYQAPASGVALFYISDREMGHILRIVVDRREGGQVRFLTEHPDLAARMINAMGENLEAGHW